MMGEWRDDRWMDGNGMGDERINERIKKLT